MARILKKIIPEVGHLVRGRLLIQFTIERVDNKAKVQYGFPEAKSTFLGLNNNIIRMDSKIISAQSEKPFLNLTVNLIGP